MFVSNEMLVLFEEEQAIREFTWELILLTTWNFKSVVRWNKKKYNDTQKEILSLNEVK